MARARRITQASTGDSVPGRIRTTDDAGRGSTGTGRSVARGPRPPASRARAWRGEGLAPGAALALGALLAVAAAVPGAAGDGAAAVRVAQGGGPGVPADQLYDTVCAHCHGADGRGRVPLPAYPAGSEERFFRGVLDGNPKGGMPPFRGLLSTEELRALFEHVRALRPASAAGADGRQLYASFCASCHGADGTGTKLGPDLRAFRGSDPEFLAIVRDGRPGTPMVPYGRTLDARQVTAIRAYLRSPTR
jgi:mono/diheme cytochrome c family protein